MKSNLKQYFRLTDPALTNNEGIWLVEWLSCRDLQSALKHSLMDATTGISTFKNM